MPAIVFLARVFCNGALLLTRAGGDTGNSFYSVSSKLPGGEGLSSTLDRQAGATTIGYKEG